LERAIWYLGAFWPGVLINIVTNKLTIDRLVASDIAARPGALTALIIIVILVLVLVLNQVRVIRYTGLLPTYLAYYITGGLVILVISLLPGLTFRLHHYVFAILLIPGTFTPTRISAIIQAFLLGMFLDGIAKWGFDSMWQTAAELQRDAALGTSLPPFSADLANAVFTSFNSTNSSLISWPNIPANLTATEGWNGFSLIIDDVERYSGTALNFSLSALEWGIPHFFRLAYQQDSVSGDYTRAATIFPTNGSFVPPLPGPS